MSLRPRGHLCSRTNRNWFPTPFNSDGQEIKQTELTCDVCGEDCFAASYLFEEEMDICPRCFASDAKGAEEYVGAEYQEAGKKAEPPLRKKKKKEDSDDEGDYKPAKSKKAKNKKARKSDNDE